MRNGKWRSKRVSIDNYQAAVSLNQRQSFMNVLIMLTINQCNYTCINYRIYSLISIKLQLLKKGLRFAMISAWAGVNFQRNLLRFTEFVSACFLFLWLDSVLLLKQHWFSF